MSDANPTNYKLLTKKHWKVFESVPMLRYCYEARPWPRYTTDNYYWSLDRATPVSDQ